MTHYFFTTCVCVSFLFIVSSAGAEEKTSRLHVSGLTVTPHMKVETMRYAKEPEPAVGARVQLFLTNTQEPKAANLAMDENTRVVFNGLTPQQLLKGKLWSWHDMPSATPEQSIEIPSDAMTVWTFNGISMPFGTGGKAKVAIGPEDNPWLSSELSFESPKCWISAVTFFAVTHAFTPETLIVHIANNSSEPIKVDSCRLWLPRAMTCPRVFYAQPFLENIQPFNGVSFIRPGDRGGFMVTTPSLPLTYVVIEIGLDSSGTTQQKLWTHLRIKPERFDISGGWLDPLAGEPFLKTLRRMHINTAHIQWLPGYSDTPLYTHYPLKYFGAMKPFEFYDTDEMLPRIHAVEFLGEPQYGGGKPVAPQEVWEQLHPYATTRLATTVTHSEERIWRDYAGLSDFPHYDAYRVTAPSADAWWKYERWGTKIYWGAPLETIGDMCRSLRELNRPMPCAIWSQGPHDGWGQYGRRQRTSPTPDEIRLQAYHAISTRITSLYWFNLSLKSVVKWRDTLEEIGRIGRELMMLSDFLLEGDAYTFERTTGTDGSLDWDLASVCGPRAALLFALDLNYYPDPKERVFKFNDARAATWRFKIPAYLLGIQDVFRMDADGIYDTMWEKDTQEIIIKDTASRVAVFIATPQRNLRHDLEEKRKELIAFEKSFTFDPAKNDADFELLASLLQEQN